MTSLALSKEIRGLLPIWIVCMAALAGAFVSRSDGLLLDAAIVAYIVGPIALGAQSIGQEYAYHTLPMLLSQPVDRRRMLLIKFAVLAVMVLPLAALASNVLKDVAAQTEGWRQFSVQALPLLGGLFVAPWMTMICRGSLAGILGTTSFAALTFIVQMVIAGAWFRIDAESARAMIIGPWSLAMIVCCALGGVLSVRRFIHLEAIEGPLPSLHLPRWRARAGRARVWQPLRALAMKELHLQQLTFAIAAFFAAGTAAVSVLQRLVPLWSDFPIGIVTQLYCAILSIWIGAIASAEERQHGTLESQLLQPAPAWQQWIVKVGVTFAVALLCGVGLPLLLFRILPASGIIPLSFDFAVLILLLTAGSIYLSSLSSSGVRAIVLALPVGTAVVLWIQTVVGSMHWAASQFAAMDNFLRFTEGGFALTLMPLLLWFGFINHTSPERSSRRIVLQAAAIGFVITASLIAARGLSLYELGSR